MRLRLPTLLVGWLAGLPRDYFPLTVLVSTTTQNTAVGPSLWLDSAQNIPFYAQPDHLDWSPFCKPPVPQIVLRTPTFSPSATALPALDAPTRTDVVQRALTPATGSAFASPPQRLDHGIRFLASAFY